MNKRKKKYIIVFSCLWIPALISLLFAFAYPPLMMEVYAMVLPPDEIERIAYASYPAYSSIVGMIIILPVFIVIILWIVYLERKGIQV